MTNANKFNLLLDVVKLMHSLADGLEAVAYAFVDSQELLTEEVPVQKPIEIRQYEKSKLAENMPSLEEVRTILADKARAGFTEEVRCLLKKYGADRLSDIDPSKYAALLAEVEVLGNG